jgi:hypothetical protein
MPSSASTRLRLNLQASGENSNTWGSLLNAQVFQLIDDAIAGRTAFTLSGTKTLTSTNFVANEARAACLDITAGTGGTVTIPGYEKLYLVRNATSGDVILTTGGSTNATVKAGNVQFVMCNGTDVYLAKERDLGSDLLTTSATPTADGHLTRKAYVDGLIATEQAARLAGDAATLATAEAYTDATSFAAGSLPGGGSTGQYVRQIAGPSADWHDPFPQVAGGAYDGKVLWSIGGATTWALPIPAQSGNSGKFLTTDGSAASWALPIPSQSGNAGKVLTTDGSSASWGVPPTAPDVIVQEQQTSGSAGSAATHGAWSTRVLNTIVRNNGTIGSLGSNQITLPSGTYYVRVRTAVASADGGDTVSFACRVYNVTASAVAIAQGESARLTTLSDTTGLSGVVQTSGVITLGSSSAIRVETFCKGSVDGVGGRALASGSAEVHATVEIWKVL